MRNRSGGSPTKVRTVTVTVTVARKTLPATCTRHAASPQFESVSLAQSGSRVQQHGAAEWGRAHRRRRACAATSAGARSRVRTARPRGARSASRATPSRASSSARSAARASRATAGGTAGRCVTVTVRCYKAGLKGGRCVRCGVNNMLLYIEGGRCRDCQRREDLKEGQVTDGGRVPSQRASVPFPHATRLVHERIVRASRTGGARRPSTSRCASATAARPGRKSTCGLRHAGTAFLLPHGCVCGWSSAYWLACCRPTSTTRAGRRRAWAAS